MTQTSPVFIVGSARSGTSIIWKAIFDSSPEIAGHPEGHFFPILKALSDAIRAYYGSRRPLLENADIMLAHLPEAETRRTVLRAVGTLANRLYEGKRWIEKTPDSRMLEVLPLVIEIWPDAKIIFARRRGLECVASRMRKFKTVPFITHCTIWSNSMHLWLHIRSILPNGYLEIDQRDIALRPLETGRRLAQFIGLGETESDKLCGILAYEHPERSGELESEEALSISEMGWTPEQISLFRDKCAVVSECYGYLETKEYSKSMG